MMCRSKPSTIEAPYRYLATAGMVLAFALQSTLLPSIAYAQGNGKGKGNSSQQRGKSSQGAMNQGGRQSGGRGNSSNNGTLMPAQVEQLVRMCDEEKLAHDVYVTLAQTSGMQIFQNIANAESQHMRAVAKLVSRYSPDAAGAQLPVGRFLNPQVQATYNSLVASGRASPIAAVTVGVKIEEMDIKDLQETLSQNPPQDVSRVLEHLQNGSRQHLRAFSRELKQLGGTYTPEFLSPQEFNNIVNSDNDRGGGKMGHRDAKGMNQGGGQSNANEQKRGPQSQKGNRGRGAGK